MKKNKKHKKVVYKEIEPIIGLVKEISGQEKEEFFRYKNIVLFKGNSLNRNLFDREFIDLTVTSPPYNVGIDYNSSDDKLLYEHYLDFTERWLTNCFCWTKSQGRLVLNIPLDKNKGGQRSVGADITTIAQKVGWKYHSTII